MRESFEGLALMATLPFEEGEKVIDMAANDDFIVIITNKGNPYVINKEGVVKRVVLQAADFNKIVSVDYLGREINDKTN